MIDIDIDTEIGQIVDCRPAGIASAFGAAAWLRDQLQDFQDFFFFQMALRFILTSLMESFSSLIRYLRIQMIYAISNDSIVRKIGKEFKLDDKGGS